MAKSRTYATALDGDSLASLTDKLQADLRRSIRQLAAFPPLSSEWMTMTKSLRRIANISEMEKKLPRDQGATLWECEEVALRYVLEDGKVNLALHLLDDYLQFLSSNASARASSRQAGTDIGDSCAAFESGVMRLLGNLWMHPEAIQTTDMPLLVQVMGELLSRAASEAGLEEPAAEAKEPAEDAGAEGASPAAGGGGDQEGGEALDDAGVGTASERDSQLGVLVLRFISAVGTNLSQLQEERAVEELRRRNIVVLASLHMSRNAAALGDEALLEGARGLSGIVENEVVRSRRGEFFPDKAALEAGAAMGPAFLDRIAKSCAEVRKSVRPLMDLVAWCKRQARRS